MPRWANLTRIGDPGASRTHNLLLRTEPLYPLSYRANTFILTKKEPLIKRGLLHTIDAYG